MTASSSGVDWAQRCWRYPEQAREAAESVIEQAQLVRNAFFGVHLYCEWGNRLAANARPTVLSLWLDEDQGRYPDDGPEPTAIIHSSYYRRHLYWRLAHPVSVEFAVDLNKRIAAWADGDSGKAGLASVLRPAGTANYKREKPDLVGGHLTGTPAWEPEVIDQAIPLLPEPDSGRGTRRYTGAPVDLRPYLDAVQVIGPAPDASAEKFAIVCPWVRQHTNGDRSGTYLMQFPSGAAHFECRHAHCAGRTWRDFKGEVGRVRTYRVNPKLRVKVRRYG